MAEVLRQAIEIVEQLQDQLAAKIINNLGKALS